jgi:hypothetical protein
MIAKTDIKSNQQRFEAFYWHNGRRCAVVAFQLLLQARLAGA